MRMQEIHQHIKLFQHLSEEEFAKVEPFITHHTFRAGDCIIQQGQQHAVKGLYMIEHGTVGLSVKAPGDINLPLSTYKENDFFASASLLEENYGDISATALETTTCYVLSREYLKVIEHYTPLVHHKIIAALAHLVCERLRSIENEIADSSLLENVQYYHADNFWQQAQMNAIQTKVISYSAYMDKCELLAQPAFSQFTAEEIQLILRYAVPLFAPRMCILTRKDMAPADLYVIIHGAVQIFTEKEDKVIKCAVLGPNDLLGQTSFIDGQPALNTAIVREDAHLLQFTPAKYQALYEKSPIVWCKLYTLATKTLVTLLRLANKQIIRTRSEND